VVKAPDTQANKRKDSPMELLQVSIMGLFATGLADLGQQLLKRGLGLPIANWWLIGRWVAGMPVGVFVHRSIADATPIKGEAVVGWISHYFIGISYAGFYLALVQVLSQKCPSLFVAMLFPFVTLAAPWFIMQPALGLGIMAGRLPNRLKVSAVTVMTHLMFGLGLYPGALGWASDWRL
jgi:hypothetical protein